jgi:hypothetical protein
MKKERRN